MVFTVLGKCPFFRTLLIFCPHTHSPMHRSPAARLGRRRGRTQGFHIYIYKEREREGERESVCVCVKEREEIDN